jgi:molybdopterin molybdotransferase
MRLRRMRGFSRLTKVDYAQSTIIDRCGGGFKGTEAVDVREAWGRVLEEDIVSTVNVPPFDRSAVDGYTISSIHSFSASKSNPAVFKVTGVSEAGGAMGKIGVGESREIYTGAQVPKGGDSVVMAEDCERKGDELFVFKAAPKFANISQMGEDLQKGSLVLARGELLRPWHVGILASIGRREVIVRKKPVIGVFSTGSELVDIGCGKPIGGRITDSTRPMTIGLVKELGCDILDGGIVEDDLSKISVKIEELAIAADMVVSIGGTSVGGKDLVPEAFLSLKGSRLEFHGLAIKPGKPAGFGLLDRKPFFMLPGYPVSALIGYELLIMPLLSRWKGIKPTERKRVKAILTRRVPTTPGIRHFLRVTLERKGEVFYAAPIAITGSGRLSSITKADGLVVVGEELEGLEEGEIVDVELLKELI